MDKNLIETLAKVIIAAGWADKKMTSEEAESLKDLLLQFQHEITFSFNLGDELWAADSGFYLDSTNDNSGLTSRQQALFDMYTESPIDTAEREQLTNELREAIWSEEDKTFVLSALKKMVEADGKITDDEQAVLNSITAKIESVDTGFFGDLGRLVRGAMQRRSEAVNSIPDREKYFEEFLKNKVYYEVRRRLDLGEANLEIPDEDIRKLSLVGGLMARVAQVDNIVLEKERDHIVSVLQNNWNLSRESAAFVIEVAMAEVTRDFDYLRMTREFLEIAAPGERGNVLDVLFVVANADGKVSTEELKEIRNIADYLLLSDNRVNEAQSKIVR